MAFLRIDFPSSILQMAEHVDVILPDDFNKHDPFEDGLQKFRTLYLLHGYYGNSTDWMRLSSIERYAGDHHIAVVMPSAYNSYYTNALHGERYFDYIADEIPRYLQKLLPLAKSKEHNFIAGLSMGGYGAIKIALHYPERYQLAASLSGALDFDFVYQRGLNDLTRTKHFQSIFGLIEDMEHSEHNLFYKLKENKKELPYLYIICGTEDFLFDSNNKFVNQLKKQNINHLYETHPGDHNWTFWDTYIQDVLNLIDKK
ncbi:MAG: alpha/beta hydrolase [Acholeplasmataceae bacterium]